jgi:hypothetical protein
MLSIALMTESIAREWDITVELGKELHITITWAPVILEAIWKNTGLVLIRISTIICMVTINNRANQRVLKG